MTDDSAFKRQVRARMAETGEKYTEARRIVVEEADRIRASLAELTGTRVQLNIFEVRGPN